MDLIMNIIQAVPDHLRNTAAFFLSVFRLEKITEELALSAAFVMLVLAVIAVLVCLFLHKWVRLVTIVSVFLLAWILHIPLSESEEVSSLFTAAAYSIKPFLMDFEFELFRNVDPKFHDDHVYKHFLLGLYTAAPVTTALTILSYFRGVIEGVRFVGGSLFNRLYVFSEMNEKSLELAEDIRKSKLRNKWFATIVFHDVYRKDEEPHMELMERAEKLRAICFRDDILHLKAGIFFWKKIEFFVIGEDESENIDHAIRLSNRYSKRRNTVIYVWARKPESACILDSFRVVPVPKNEKKTSPSLRLRRIDDVEIFAWNTLKDADLFKNVEFKDIKFESVENPKTVPPVEQRISILIVGMGEYGMEFLKTAVWMYQCYGVRVEITAIDIGTGGEKRLRHECPELLEMNDCTVHGEAHYSIRIVENIDIFGGDLERMLFTYPDKYLEFAERLQRVHTVFVTLGEDDRNIRAALELRTLFDRLHLSENYAKAKSATDVIANFQQARKMESMLQGSVSEEVKKDTQKRIAAHYASVGKKVKEMQKTEGLPVICTPVYDTLKMKNIRSDDTQNVAGLRTYENIPYHIDFRGSFKEQYSYANISREELEDNAFVYHRMWAGSPAEARASYEQFEYNRHSSMARALHNTMIEQYVRDLVKCSNPDREKVPEKKEEKAKWLRDMKDCVCTGCTINRRIEHMRWNAYMRTQGFCCPDADLKYAVKSARSKLHYELIPFDNLPDEEKLKDSAAIKTEPVKK